MRNIVKNSFFFLLFLATSGLLSGCIAASVGSALFTMLPSSYDYINKNSPSSTQSVALSDVEEVSIVTLKELDFSIEDVSDTVIRESENLFTKDIIAHPTKAKKRSLKVIVQLIQITEKVTKIVVTAKDSSLSYDGATAQAILEEILLNIEMEKSFVDLDRFLIKTDQKKELKRSLEKEKAAFNVENKEAETVEQQTSTIEETSESAPESIHPPVQDITKPEAIDVTEANKPTLKKKINSIITSKGRGDSFIKNFKGLGAAPYTVKIGTFSNLKNVDKLMKEWNRKGQIPFYSSISVREKTLYRVFLNRFPDRSTANNFVLTLREGKLLHGEAAQPFRASYAIKAGECMDKGECEMKVTKLIAFGVSPYLHAVTLEGVEKHLILIGGYTMPEEAESAMTSLENLGVEYSLINP